MTISNLNVDVSNTEIEIITSTLTNKSYDRIFGVGNREKTIVATVYGSNDDGQTWEEDKSETIGPNNYKTMVLGPSHMPRVKLIVKTSITHEISEVDAFLTYNPPDE